MHSARQYSGKAERLPKSRRSLIIFQSKTYFILPQTGSKAIVLLKKDVIRPYLTRLTGNSLQLPESSGQKFKELCGVTPSLQE